MRQVLLGVFIGSVLTSGIVMGMDSGQLSRDIARNNANTVSQYQNANILDAARIGGNLYPYPVVPGMPPC